MLALVIMLGIFGVTSIIGLCIFSFRLKREEQLIKAIILITCWGFIWLNVWFFAIGLIILKHLPN